MSEAEALGVGATAVFALLTALVVPPATAEPAPAAAEVVLLAAFDTAEVAEVAVEAAAAVAAPVPFLW